MSARSDARDGVVRLVLLVVRVAPGLFAFAVATTVAAAATAPAFYVTSGWLVREAQREASVLAPVLVLAGVFLASQVLPPIVEQVAGVLRGRTVPYLVQRLLGALETPAALERLEEPATLDRLMLAKGIGPGNITPGHAIPGLFLRARKWMQTAAAAVIVARFDIRLAAIVLAVTLFERAVISRGFISFGQATLGSRAEHRRGACLRRLGFDGPSAREAKLFGASEWLIAQFRSAASDALANLWRRRRKVATLQALPIAMDTVMVAGALVFLVTEGIAGQLTVAEVVVAAQAVFGVGAILHNHGDELQIGQGVTSLGPMLDLDRELRVPTPGGRPASPPRQSIRFDNVAYRYPNRDDDAVHALSLEVAAGTSLALVGANGAGKTTIVKLLAGLLRPTGGAITVDGVPLDAIDRASWQRQVAAVFQDFARIRFSPRDAIGLGAPEHVADHAGQAAAASAAGAGDFIAALPSGWDTPLDRTWDDGIDLSGGQWQRLALARALFAVQHGAGILVLDEPAAQLDARGEADLHERFLEITRGMTTIVVSHRFSTVRRADRIVVVDRGAVLEDGTHDELLRLGGIYAKYFRLQADAFQDGGT